MLLYLIFDQSSSNKMPLSIPMMTLKINNLPELSISNVIAMSFRRNCYTSINFNQLSVHNHFFLGNEFSSIPISLFLSPSPPPAPSLPLTSLSQSLSRALPLSPTAPLSLSLLLFPSPSLSLSLSLYSSRNICQSISFT